MEITCFSYWSILFFSFPNLRSSKTLIVMSFSLFHIGYFAWIFAFFLYKPMWKTLITQAFGNVVLIYSIYSISISILVTFLFLQITCFVSNLAFRYLTRWKLSKYMFFFFFLNTECFSCVFRIWEYRFISQYRVFCTNFGVYLFCRLLPL